MIQIGVDFGGTKIEAAALDAGGNVLIRRRVATPKSYAEALDAVAGLVEGIETETGIRATVGVGTPGALSPVTAKMMNANSVFLNGRPLREDLTARLARPVRLANDANCLALSEAVDGAAAGAPVVFAIVLGTGCGGGLAVNGALIEGHNGIAGEWGHSPLPAPCPEELPGPRCWCGREGCLDLWVSGTGLARDYLAATGEALAGEAIIAAMRRGQLPAMMAFDRLIDRLGRALAGVANIIDPDVIVIGGGLSNADELYQRLPEAISRHVFCDHWQSKILPARWGDSSGVRGAARLWPLPAAAQ